MKPINALYLTCGLVSAGMIGAVIINESRRKAQNDAIMDANPESVADPSIPPHNPSSYSGRKNFMSKTTSERVFQLALLPIVAIGVIATCDAYGTLMKKINQL